jgi:predicted nuclease with TOPRIM domain
MKLKILILILPLLGCTKPSNPNFNVTVPVGIKTDFQDTEHSEKEAKADNVRADLRKLPDFPAEPLLKGDAAKNDGILISPRNAAEASLNSAEAERLSIENNVIKSLKTKEDSLNEAYIKKLESDLQKCKQKSWWDKNGNETMLGVGLAVGILTSILIFDVSTKIVNP